MDSRATIRLAADVLAEHFGTAVKRVGTALLERGRLSVQQLLQFVNPADAVGEEPLKFSQVRDALCTLVRHGLVQHTPHPQAAAAEQVESTVMVWVYSIDTDAVLARLHIPHFLEHTLHAHGEQAYELLFTVLRYGRVAEGTAIEEAKRELQKHSRLELQSSTSSELRQVLETSLVGGNLLRVVEPCGRPTARAQPQPSASSSSPAAALGAENGQGAGAAPAEAEAQEPGGRKRKREGDQDGDEGGGALVEASSRRPERVYCYNLSTFTLCACKNLVCRYVEKHYDRNVAQVLAALLTAVEPGDHGVREQSMSFQAVDGKLRELRLHQPGRDPAKEGEKLRRQLELLSRHADGLVRMKQVHGGDAWEVQLAGGPNKGRWARCGSVSQGNKPDCKHVTVPSEGQELRNVPQKFLRRCAESQPEWSVDWGRCKRKLLDVATSQLIRDEFGQTGLRIYNFLRKGNPPQRLEEKGIFGPCMIDDTECREVLSKMVQRYIVRMQEVPKSPTASFWLYYVDPVRVQQVLHQNLLQAMLNLRVRFRHESAKLRPLESRANSLFGQEKAMLRDGRCTEDILERTFLVLDSALLLFRVNPPCPEAPPEDADSCGKGGGKGKR